MQERTAELAESEARFRCFTELASDWYWEQDENGNFKNVSGPILEMLGVQVDDQATTEYKSRKIDWDQDKRIELQAKISARQPFLDFELSRILGNGLKQPFRVNGQLIFGPGCCFVGYRGVGVEITFN